jgi:hypothetical protein
MPRSSTPDLRDFRKGFEAADNAWLAELKERAVNLKSSGVPRFVSCPECRKQLPVPATLSASDVLIDLLNNRRPKLAEHLAERHVTDEVPF